MKVNSVQGINPSSGLVESVDGEKERVKVNCSNGDRQVP